MSLLPGLLLAALGALPPPAAGPGDVQAHRNLGKAHYERSDHALAVRELLKVLELGPASARDHFNAGMALLQNGEYDRALSAFTTARQIDPGLMDVDFGLGVLYKREMRNPQALAAFERVAAGDPGDPCAWFNVGAVLFNLGRWPEAQQAFQRVLAMGFPAAQNFYVGALFRQATVLQRLGRRDEAQKYFEEFLARREQIPAVSLAATALENGRHGRVEAPPTPPAVPSRPSPSGVAFAPLAVWRLPSCPSAVATPRVALGDVEADGLVDVFVTSSCGQSRLFRNRGGARFEDATSAAGLGGSGGGLDALFLDHDNTGVPSLLVLQTDGARLYRNRQGRFTDATASSGLAEVRATARTTAGAFDLDNDGQLDLFLAAAGTAAGPGALRVFRNEGAGRFRELALPTLGEVRAAAFADFDGDGFADLLAARRGGAATLLRNTGDARFEAVAVAGRLPSGDALHIEVGDYDRDGAFDALVSGSAGWGLLRQTARGRLEVVPGAAGPAPAPGGAALFLDADGDGSDDVLLRDATGAARLWAYRGRGRFEEERVQLTAAASALAAVADLDGAGRLDLVEVGADGRVRLWRRRGAPSRGWLGLAIAGDKSNRSGVGAVVEVKAGEFYRKELVRGLPLLVATGGRAKVDVVRVTWTNGIVQNELDVATGRRHTVLETDRQSSSCPFVYLWDGARFRFLTDAVGRSPLGERDPAGRPVPWNTEDYVRIPPGALEPRDGRYVFQITEELRESAYLDAAELIAVDHPEGEELYVDESFPGEPVPVLHRVTAPQPPSSATNDRGDDLRPLLLEADGRYVADFERAEVPGLTTPHAIVLDPGPLPEGARAKLLLTGWVYWVTASGMRALSGRTDLALDGPSLQVRDAEGAWVTAIESIGIPSGIGRTMVIDLAGKYRSADRAVRIATNLAVYWDRALFAIQAGEPENDGAGSEAVRLHRLRPAEADLHHRGFSAVVREARGSRPDDFDYDRLLEPAPWNAAPGSYTRFGAVETLVEARDDRLVVMAPGDELTLVFDPAPLPAPPPGWRRDFLLRLTGWAKDHDPNTVAGASVEPLPFRAMRAYPPTGSEGSAAPGGEPWRAEFQTRRMPRLLPDLAPLVGR